MPLLIIKIVISADSTGTIRYDKQITVKAKTPNPQLLLAGKATRQALPNSKLTFRE